MIKAQEALERLRAGNRRFASETQSTTDHSCPIRRREVVAGQEPIAVILGCSDSRVPAEIVFDQGLGDLFVIRVAGNIAASSQIGSVELAAENFGTRLVVVLGHSGCGAVLATLEALEAHVASPSPHLRAVIDHIRPSLEPLMEREIRNNREDLVEHAIRANIRATADHLRQGSEILDRLIREDGLLIVCAEYSLETGEVEFLD